MIYSHDMMFAVYFAVWNIIICFGLAILGELYRIKDETFLFKSVVRLQGNFTPWVNCSV